MIIQNKTGCLVVAAICLTTLSVSIHARSVSGAHGGSASATAGSRSAETARGGSASWSRGSGTSVETAGGRSASTSATAYHAPAAGRGYPGAPAAGYHPPVPAYGYRPPVNVNYGYSSGQVAAAGVAGLAVGAMAGSAAAKSAPPPANDCSGTTADESISVSSGYQPEQSAGWLCECAGRFDPIL